jgi:signal transduction histidine kinase
VGAYLAELLGRFAYVPEIDRVHLVMGASGSLLAPVDVARLDRIVLNLLTNALKYSPPESRVEMGAEGAGGWVIIKVADHGPGIPDSDLTRVFDRFYRGRRTAARGGLGLGLYSVRLLVEAHGGTVRVERSRGGGATILVALPSSPAPLTRSSAARSGTARWSSSPRPRGRP